MRSPTLAGPTGFGLRFALPLAVALVAAPAWAVLTPSASALGWTADGAWFVYTVGFDAPDSWFLVSARSGEATELKDPKEFERWAATHPLAADAPAGPRSPDGKVELVLEAGGGGWVEDLWRPPAKAPRAVSCKIKRGAETLNCQGFAPRPGADLTPYWSPDGRRLALLSTYQACAPSGNGDFTCDQDFRVHLDRTSGPSIQLVAKELPQASVDKAVAALEQAAFAPTGQSAAQAAREKSVVYVARGQAALGKKIAAAIPGGATVDTLSWKSAFDVVVALGASAR